jgi:hypothetical protein
VVSVLLVLVLVLVVSSDIVVSSGRAVSPLCRGFVVSSRVAAYELYLEL